MLARILTGALVVATALSLLLSAEGFCRARATGVLQRRTPAESGSLTFAEAATSAQGNPTWLFRPSVIAIPTAKWMAARPSASDIDPHSFPPDNGHPPRPIRPFRTPSRTLLVLRT
jgi:hypothetical protein